MTQADSNHPQHHMEIAFSQSQQLVSNKRPEDFYVPLFFHVQCNIASLVLINEKFLNCLRTMQFSENEKYKYLHHYVLEHILYVPIRVTSFRESYFRFTNELNHTLTFSDSSSVIVLHICPILQCRPDPLQDTIFSYRSYKEWFTTVSGSCYLS